MQKRGLLIGTYNTAEHGWTMTSCVLSPPAKKTNFVDKTGGDGSWNLSTALTDGIPRYHDRTLTATFELSEGDRLSREDVIDEMINLLDGFTWPIEHPDDPTRYLVGDVNVAKDYNDLAHAAITVTATVEPWRYNQGETGITLTVTEDEQTATLLNRGRRAVVPTLLVTGEVHLTYGAKTLTVASGTYHWPDLLLTTGEHKLTYSGEGMVAIKYREARL